MVPIMSQLRAESKGSLTFMVQSNGCLCKYAGNVLRSSDALCLLDFISSNKGDQQGKTSRVHAFSAENSTFGFEGYPKKKKPHRQRDVLVRLVSDKETNKPRGYGFIEYMHTRDMKAAYKQADGRKIEGRRVLVDVERGRTVPNWRPRRLGGGLGTTRVGGEEVNQRYSGREQVQSGGQPRSEEPRVREERHVDLDREKSRERGKEKDKEREREKSRERSRERSHDKPRDRDHREDRHHRDRDRTRDRDRDRDRERDRGRDRDRTRERGRDRGRDYERDRETRDRDRDRPRERDRDYEVGDPEHDRGRSRDKESDYDHRTESKHERDRHGERERDYDHTAQEDGQGGLNN
ncbi:U1 small nuclear ribonucleoprotein-70K [Prunus dulcis]|uniref:U1 small nuclear ribonucleoprotein 70 kDa n=1 Tax=Prunus dulcis TaxID=3755 RepID=A0A4Y1RVV8_PRUDU|nr:U1 small nuclear ribonucleoprotein-70K [Prunus dulcis]